MATESKTLLEKKHLGNNHHSEYCALLAFYVVGKACYKWSLVGAPWCRVWSVQSRRELCQGLEHMKVWLLYAYSQMWFSLYSKERHWFKCPIFSILSVSDENGVWNKCMVLESNRCTRCGFSLTLLSCGRGCCNGTKDRRRNRWHSGQRKIKQTVTQ